MPTQQQPLANGHASLFGATTKHYGGVPGPAKRLGPPVQNSNAPANHCRGLPTLGAALLGCGAEHGTANTMPTQSQLHTNGRPGPTNAMGPYHGGVGAVAGRLGLGVAQGYLPDEHLGGIEVVGRELLLWVGQHGTPCTMPAGAQLGAFGRAGIVGGARKHHCGASAVAAAPGPTPGSNPPPVGPGAYWLKWEGVVAGVPTVGKACGVAGQVPTKGQLLANGYTSLHPAIAKHCGGVRSFAARLGQTKND